MARRLRFSVKTLEHVRRHSWRAAYKELLYDALRLESNHTVVEIGCGTGAFTRILAEKLQARKGGKIIGLDKDKKLIAAAKRLSRGSNRPSSLEYREGDARAIPLPEGYADRVVCQAVLWLLTGSDRTKVIGEMIRVCKSGGLVAAVEGSLDTSVVWFPDNPRLSELYAKKSSAELEGYRKIYGYDRSIGYKLPSLFKKMGLTQVRLDGVADSRLRSDDRFPIGYSREVLRLWYHQYSRRFLSKLDKIAGEERKRAFVEKYEPVLTAGGMGWDEIVELNKLRVAYYARLAGRGSIRRDSAVEAGIAFITTGVKV